MLHCHLQARIGGSMVLASPHQMMDGPQDMTGRAEPGFYSITPAVPGVLLPLLLSALIGNSMVSTLSRPTRDGL